MPCYGRRLWYEAIETITFKIMRADLNLSSPGLASPIQTHVSAPPARSSLGLRSRRLIATTRIPSPRDAARPIALPISPKPHIATVEPARVRCSNRSHRRAACAACTLGICLPKCRRPAIANSARERGRVAQGRWSESGTLPRLAAAAGLAPDVKFSCGKAQLYFTV